MPEVVLSPAWMTQQWRELLWMRLLRLLSKWYSQAHSWVFTAVTCMQVGPYPLGEAEQALELAGNLAYIGPASTAIMLAVGHTEE